MKNNTFEEFLQNKHSEDYHGLDDDMPDAFEAWMSQLDVAEVEEYAEEWGRQLIEKLIEETKRIHFRLSSFANQDCNDAFSQGTLEAAEMIRQQLRAKWLGKEKQCLNILGDGQICRSARTTSHFFSFFLS
jgi:hypothetical protein